MPRPDKKDNRKDASKRQKGKKRPQKKWKAFVITGDTITRRLKSCPKCGDGVHLALHKDRQSCGKCGYTEFSKKSA